MYFMTYACFSIGLVCFAEHRAQLHGPILSNFSDQSLTRFLQESTWNNDFGLRALHESLVHEDCSLWFVNMTYNVFKALRGKAGAAGLFRDNTTRHPYEDMLIASGRSALQAFPALKETYGRFQNLGERATFFQRFTQRVPTAITPTVRFKWFLFRVAYFS